ncbi:MAG: hypothetical protein ACRCXB_24055 [Aeromonadaceae bacterium]
MKIKLSPLRSDSQPLQAIIQDQDTIIINGKTFDFSRLKNGETLPISAIGGSCPFSSDIERDESGDLHFTLSLPHGAFAPAATLFPAAYDTPIDINSGELPVPPYNEVPA